MIENNELYKLSKDLKVLYVEDDESFQKETCEVLDYFFDTVDLACDGQEAFDKYILFEKENSKYYDIVFTDISMPNMDGIELTKAIYEQNIEQAIVIISAHDESHYLLELVNIGIEQFLQKPIVYDKILEVIYNTSKKIVKSLEDELVEEDTTIIKLAENSFWNKETLVLKTENQEVKLTKKETLLMQLFIKNSSKISTDEEIFSILWDDKVHLASVETLTPIISRFRKKLPLQIENVYGLGYRFIF